MPAPRSVNRMPHAHETLVRWYLRFNGYLGEESFVVHEPDIGGVPQGAEFDTLAVRFPFSREYAGFAIENDPRLLDVEAIQKSLVDFTIAEVKSGENLKPNRIWRLTYGLLSRKDNSRNGAIPERSS
jgi:hypothetical protein